jgi:hypothetical protein
MVYCRLGELNGLVNDACHCRRRLWLGSFVCKLAVGGGRE